MGLQNIDFDNDDEFDEMEMPTPCQKCDGWFDLNDGTGSEKWFPRTIICPECGEREQAIIDVENDIEDLQEEIDSAKEDISAGKKTIRVNTLKICVLKDKLQRLEDE